MSRETASPSSPECQTLKPNDKSTAENESLRLQFYFEEFSKRLENPTPSDLLAVFIYSVMLDSNFQPLVDDVKSLPNSWMENSPKSYKCSFSPLECFCRCELVLTNIGNVTMIVNLLCSESKNVFHLALPIGQCVRNPGGSSIDEKFENILNLKSNIRNIIVSPGKADLLSSVGFTGCNINALPFEILHKIFLFIGPLNVVKLSSTCRRLRYAAFDPKLWENFFLRDFKSEHSALNSAENVDWYEKYQDNYKKKHNIKNPYVHRRRVVSEEMVYIPYRPALFRFNRARGFHLMNEFPMNRRVRL